MILQKKRTNQILQYSEIYSASFSTTKKKKSFRF